MIAKTGKLLLGLMLVFVLLAIPGYAPAGEKEQEKASFLVPTDNQGKKFRIGYCETEPWINYAGTLYALVKGLEQMDWVTNSQGLNYIEGQMDTSAMWQWLARNEVSPYIEFVEDGHYTLSLMEGEAEETVIERLQRQDLDLLIVMGTKAGKAMASDGHSIPVAVFSTSNAVRSGIIKSEKDSGTDNVWAHMDSKLYQRQISVFHDIFTFKKMGMVYENSATGKIYAAVEDAEKVAAEQGFELVCHPVAEPVDEADRERYYADLLSIHQQLAQAVDAFYLTMAPIELQRLPELLEPFYARNIPVFSQLGSEEVKAGALMSVARADFSEVGQFGAQVLIQLLQGVSARQLPQVFENIPQIALNLEAARKIGYKPPFEILLVADEIYQRVESPEDN